MREIVRRRLQPLRVMGVTGLILVTACGDNLPLPGPGPFTMATRVNCDETTEVVLPDTAIGQTARAVVLAQRNDGATDARPLSLTIDGPDAASFAIDAASSSCDALPDAPGDDPPPARSWVNGEICSVAITFAPTSLGPQHAALHLADTELPVTATGVTSSAELIASLRNVDMLSGALATGDPIEYDIVNQGTAPIALGEASVSGLGLEAASPGSSGEIIAPGSSLRANLHVAQHTHGCTSGAFRITSSTNTLEIPITSWMLGSVTVSTSGRGSGHISSWPRGIDCWGGEGVCTRVFFEDHVELRATPVSGQFLGWGAGCEDASTCTVEPLVIDGNGTPGLARANAAFASPEARAVRISVSGTGVGRVLDATSTAVCSHSCTDWIEPGQYALLTARTPERFGGWGGACTGTSKVCRLGVVDGEREVTAVFLRDDRELRMVLDGSVGSFTAGAFAPDRDLVVAGPAWLSRRAPDGELRWTRGIPFSPLALALDEAGAIYGISTRDLFKLDAEGHVLWRRGLDAQLDLEPNALTLLPDGRVAAIAYPELRVLTAGGETSWTANMSACLPSAVAASPDNVVVVACRDGVLARFDAAGAPLPSWAIPDRADRVHTAALAFDRQGALFIHATRVSGYEGTRLVTRLDSTGAARFTWTEPTPAIRLPWLPWSTVARPGIRITWSGQAFLYLPHHRAILGKNATAVDGGGMIQTVAASGLPSWTIDKAFDIEYTPFPTYDALSIADAACDDTGRCALLGSYQGGWIEEFSVP